MQNYFDTVSPPLFTTDFHYFRIARKKWELMLTRLAQMGTGMITLTVPWRFHQFEQGTVDLNGATNARRNLIGLIETCAVLNLHCILQPGPYSSNSGILNNGLPGWLPSDSDKFNAGLLPATQSWFNTLSKALAQYQWPNGPIVALNIDDAGQEPFPTYSKELTEIRWPIWLRKHYQGIEALNQAYGTTYRNVSVVPFPKKWSEDPAPLERDAKAFLADMDVDTQSGYAKTLVDAGWHIPVYPSILDTQPELPTLQTHSLTTSGELPASLDNAILNLQHPIQVDPDPTDVGNGPVWANGAPIRADGSLRQSFWDIRQYLWSHAISTDDFDTEPLALSFETGGIVTSNQDLLLKISLAKGIKPDIYRLDFAGKIAPADRLKAVRAKLTGPYLTEDNTTQTDFILYINNPSAPLEGFLAAYLQTLLKSQLHALTRCAVQAEELAQTLNPAAAEASGPAHQKPAPYTLAEARRGLKEADKALRKALTSIGGLEGGFDTILGRSSRDVSQPAVPSVAISPEVFEGHTQEIVLKARQVCKEVTPKLKSTATSLQQSLVASQGFTLEQYRHEYNQAVSAAQIACDPLLDIITELRTDIASEALPLVLWRVHNQLLEIAEGLRWGVTRGL